MQFKSAGDAKFFDSNRTITGGRHFIHIEMDILALKCCSFPREQNESDQNMLFPVLANYLEQNHCILNFKTKISKVFQTNATFVEVTCFEKYSVIT